DGIADSLKTAVRHVELCYWRSGGGRLKGVRNRGRKTNTTTGSRGDADVLC
ncbi:hypothetical protein BgiBS90_013522, partial [Biomphalaria glabrata]